MKILYFLCAICCFGAILNLPIQYYTFLRIIVSIASITMIYKWLAQKNFLLAIIFALVLLAFNPIFPVYLHRKNLWIPFDVLTGLLFLIVVFYKKRNIKIEESQVPILPVPKTYTRDRIVSTKILRTK